MDILHNLLQVSAKLYQQMGSIPKGEERDKFTEEINFGLDERGKLIDSLRQEGFVIDPQNKIHVTIMDLDKGIRERLQQIMQVVKQDMKDLQNSKKHEKQYMNPYSNVRVMDGMYYDKKK